MDARNEMLRLIRSRREGFSLEQPFYIDPEFYRLDLELIWHRDWLFVGDHCGAIRRVLDAGRVGETYNVGGNAERENIQVVRAICALLDAKRPLPDGRARESLITFVADRPGHDRRYAIDASKIERELGWTPTVTFEQGIERTVDWYLDNSGWVERVLDGSYRLERIGQA